MKITFDNQKINEFQNKNILADTMVQKSGAGEKSSVGKPISGKKSLGAIASFDGADRSFGQEINRKSFFEKDKMSLAELSLQAGGVDPEVLQNQMILCSHTMSEEDYEKLRENGFDPKEMEPGETVTILDKIKAELLKGGTEIIGYTDQLDVDTLTASVGSETLARSIAGESRQQDIPLQEDTLEEITKAVQLGEEITQFTEKDQVYLLENSLEPTIHNLSMSAFGSSAVMNFSAMENAPAISREELTGFLERNQIASTEENMETANWLISKGLDITRENIEVKQGLDSLQFPLSEDILVKAAVSAIADGEEALDGNVLDSASLWEKSAVIAEKMGEAVEKWDGVSTMAQMAEAQEDAGTEITVRNQELQKVDKRIRLEEVRLLMTVDANKALLESDFTIDTKPMEEALSALKKIREEMATSLFPKQENAVELYDRYEETNEVVLRIAKMPLDTLGEMRNLISESTLPSLAEHGEDLARRLKAAGENYETMMTTPRADLGDRIQKAFANVDDILQDLSLDTSKENEKAVRVLAYCKMPIDRESVVAMEGEIAKVENLVKKMQPAAVLKMIRDGVNPMERTVEELTQYFEGLSEEYREESEKYSRFLYHLEHNNQITAEEKESFIGVYRLLRQIEKGDSEAIGRLYSVGAEMSMKNLLSAVRSSRAKSMNVQVDDTVGARTEVVKWKTGIEEQIQAAFTETVEKAYQKEQLEEYREMIQKGNQELLEKLMQLQTEVSPENIRSGEQLFTHPEWMLQQMAATRGKSAFKMTGEAENPRIEETVTGSHVAEGSDNLGSAEDLGDLEYQDFYDSYQADLHQMLEVVEQNTLEAEAFMDVRELQLLHRQMSIASKAAEQNEFFFSVETADETVANIHLLLAEGENRKGTISLQVEAGEKGSIFGELSLQAGTLTGYLAGNQETTVMEMRDMVDIIGTRLPEGVALGRVDVINEESWKTRTFFQEKGENEEQETAVLYKIATEFIKGLLQ